MKIASIVWKLWQCLHVSPKSIKGDNLVKLHYRVMSICQKIALVMVSTFVKFAENSLNFVKVMAEIC